MLNDTEEDMYGPEKTFTDGAKSVTLQCKTNFLSTAQGKTVKYTPRVVDSSGYGVFRFANTSVISLKNESGSEVKTASLNQVGEVFNVMVNRSDFPEGTYKPTIKIIQLATNKSFDGVECPDLVVVGDNAPALTDDATDDIFKTGEWTTIFPLWGSLTSGGHFSIPLPIPNVQAGASLGSIAITYTTANPVPLQPRTDLYLPKTAHSRFATKAEAETWYNGTGLNTAINRVIYSKYSSSYWDRHVKPVNFIKTLTASLSGTAPSTPGIYYFPMGSIITGVNAGIRGGKAAIGRYCVLGGGFCYGELTAPILSAPSTSCNSITLTWPSVNFADSYDLEKNGAIISSVSSPYVDTVSPNTSYTYKLIAKNVTPDFTETKDSNIVTIPTPTCSSTCGTANNTTLIGEPSGTAACPTGATRSGVTDSNNTYTWTCSQTGYMTSNCSANKLTTPTITNTSNSCTSETISWSAANATSYDVKRKLSSDVTYTSLLTGTTNTSYSDTSLIGGTSYDYRVYAKSGSLSADTFKTVITIACPVITHTLSYNANGGTGGVPASVTVAENATTSVASNLVGNTKSGYDFNGWNTAANGSGTDYTSGQTLTMGTSNVTLYAKWTPVNDTTAPTITAFTLPGTSSSLTVPVTIVTSETVGVSYFFLEAATIPDGMFVQPPSTPSSTAPGWLSTKPATFTFPQEG